MPVMGESEEEDYIIPASKGSIEDPESDTQNLHDYLSWSKTTKKKIIHKGPTPKIHGVGPTENGVPITPRGNVDDEHAGDWYRTMYKRLHASQKPKDDQEVITVRVKRGLSHYRDDGYISEPEHNPEERRRFSEKRWPYEHSQDDLHPTKSYSVYRVSPKRIEDYQPGISSVTTANTAGQNDKMYQPSRYNPSPQSPPKLNYVFNEDDSYRMVKIAKENQQQYPSSKIVQREWYRNVQKGSEIPTGGFRRSATSVSTKESPVGPCPFVQQSRTSDFDLLETHRSLEDQSISLERDYEDLKALAQSRENEAERVRQDASFRRLYEEVDQQTRQPQESGLSSLDALDISPQVPGHRGEIGSVYETVFYTPDNKEVIMLGRVIYDFIAHASRELNLKKGDLVYIFKKIDRNWYEGECLGKTGIFPVRYVDVFPPSSIDTLANVRIEEGVATGRFAFSSKNPGELSFKVGEKLRLVRRIDHNWFEARIGNQQGLVPENYLTIIQEPTELRKN